MPDDILIVDDEADIRELVSGILQDEGYITQDAGYELPDVCFVVNDENVIGHS